jgi:hypothetical protein
MTNLSRIQILEFIRDGREHLRRHAEAGIVDTRSYLSCGKAREKEKKGEAC